MLIEGCHKGFSLNPGGKVDSTVKVDVILQNPQKDVLVLDILAIILTRRSS